MSGPDEDTDKIFPPFPETRAPNMTGPIPIGPSIRQEFLAHRKDVNFALSAFAKQLDAALARLYPDVTGASTARRVANGAVQAGKLGGIVLAVLGVLQVALKAKHPELAGPLGDLLKLFE